MYVLLEEFGYIPVTDAAYVWNGSAPRQFASISELVDEAAISRLHGGLHYMFAMDGAK